MEIKEQAVNQEAEKVHPWRRCGKGEHLVCEHPVHVPPSKKHPEGKDTICHGHCAKNPSGKDELSYAEIKYISGTYFMEDFRKYYKILSEVCIPAKNERLFRN